MLMIAAPALRYSPGQFGEKLHLLAATTVERATALGIETCLVGLEDGTEEELDHAWQISTGVILLGGHDVDPEFYGGAKTYPQQGEHLPTADARSLALIERCRGASKPLLGICRGHQLINIAYGGTLDQHLDNYLTHGKEPGVPGMLPHDVLTVPESGIAAAIGRRAQVWSGHHQAIARLGDGLQATAHAAHDGCIEAVEALDAPIMGVQWHPEEPEAPATGLHVLLRWVADHASS